MPVPVQGFTHSLGGKNLQIELPDRCPYCKSGISAIPAAGGFTGHVKVNETPTQPNQPPQYLAVDLQVMLRCPLEKCQQIFVGHYVRAGGSWTEGMSQYWRLVGCAPNKFEPRTFEQIVAERSPTFVKIYNQAMEAEAIGLDEICGPGYRKALEFLMKDHLCQVHPNDRTEIESRQLWPCIDKFVNDPKLKSCARRATWLGNDETHYVRKWPDKDLQDLKKLIELTLHWIAVSILTAELESDMPEAGPAKVDAAVATGQAGPKAE